MPRGTTPAWGQAVPAKRGAWCGNTLQAQNAPILPELKKFYADHRVKDDSSRELGQYISLALLVGSPPDFKLTVDRKNFLPTRATWRAFFPSSAPITPRPKCLFSGRRSRSSTMRPWPATPTTVRQSFVLAEAYMRFPAGGYLGRTYAIYIDLMGAPEQVQARIYGLNYFLVVTPSET